MWLGYIGQRQGRWLIGVAVGAGSTCGVDDSCILFIICLPHGTPGGWGAAPSAEVLSVHAEFKRLANESEKRQREEALREEAAAEEARREKRSPNAQRAAAGQSSSQQQLDSSGGIAAANASLGSSQSMPALG